MTEVKPVVQAVVQAVVKPQLNFELSPLIRLLAQVNCMAPFAWRAELVDEAAVDDSDLCESSVSFVSLILFR